MPPHMLIIGSCSINCPFDRVPTRTHPCPQSKPIANYYTPATNSHTQTKPYPQSNTNDHSAPAYCYPNDHSFGYLHTRPDAITTPSVYIQDYSTKRSATQLSGNLRIP
jgi:hypothetical protein